MITNSTEQTITVAADLAKSLLPKLAHGPVIISLQGDYGAGKTQFVKGLAQALGIEQEIVSPSYVYMRNYPFEIEQGTVPGGRQGGELVHIDAWRIKSESDFQLVGIQAFLKPGYLIAIEWPQMYADSLLTMLNDCGFPYSLVEVKIAEGEGDKREITIL